MTVISKSAKIFVSKIISYDFGPHNSGDGRKKPSVAADFLQFFIKYPIPVKFYYENFADRLGKRQQKLPVVGGGRWRVYEVSGQDATVTAVRS